MTKVLERGYRIEKSSEPNVDEPYIVVGYSKTDYGAAAGRIFKGTYKQCQSYVDMRKERDSKSEK